MNWYEHWQSRASAATQDDFLRQVGKTFGGVTITPEQFSILSAQIRDALQLCRTDRVLDLCCGNGLVTCRLASSCREILGIDYSEVLIRTARDFNRPANVQYLCDSVLTFDTNAAPLTDGFDKVYMYEALQHFAVEDFPILLNQISAVTRPGAPVLFGSIPDRDHIWRFYNTDERVADYHRRIKEDREAIGTWWDRDSLATMARTHGFSSLFIDQHPALHTAHYRFDMLLTRNAADVDGV